MSNASKSSDTEFLKRLKASPIGRELHSAQNREIGEQRRLLAARLEQLEQERARDNSEYENRAKTLFAQHEKLKVELLDVGRNLNQTTAVHLAAVSIRTIEQSQI